MSAGKEKVKQIALVARAPQPNVILLLGHKYFISDDLVKILHLATNRSRISRGQPHTTIFYL